jgi:hypothetical protein
MTVKGGRAHYGQALGILTLDTKCPRIPGDVGNASTYKFPVCFKTVHGALASRVVSATKGTDQRLLKPFINGAKELEAEGGQGRGHNLRFLGYLSTRDESSDQDPSVHFFVAGGTFSFSDGARQKDRNRNSRFKCTNEEAFERSRD